MLIKIHTTTSFEIIFRHTEDTHNSQAKHTEETLGNRMCPYSHSKNCIPKKKTRKAGSRIRYTGVKMFVKRQFFTAREK